MSIDLIKLWHERARPAPNDRDFDVQLGCHFEEFAEMLECVDTFDEKTSELIFELQAIVGTIALRLKKGESRAFIVENSRKFLLDSIADQIVTGVGVGHCAGMKVTEALRRVNTSNWSKYDNDGQPIFDANGKIAKGPNYHEPDLEGLA